MKQIILNIITVLALLCAPLAASADSDVTAEKAAQKTPSGWTPVNLPTITIKTTVDITSKGASTSSSDNASAIQAAIDEVYKAGGGMVVVPSGTWLSGPIVLKSNVVFHISVNATIKLLPYGGIGEVKAGTGYYPTASLKDGKYSYSVFMTGSNSMTNVIVEGEGETSVIDGQGDGGWWRDYKSLGTRPSLIRFTSGSKFLFRNFKMQNSPGTNLTLGQSGNASHFTVHNVTISNPDSEAANPSHNTDGIPVWGPYVNIYDCNISTGDDNIVCDSKAHHVHAWNIACGYGHGMSIGSYTEQTHDIIYEDITFNKTGSGFRIKTNSDRSGNDQEGTSSNGAVKNIICRNATMTGCPSPIKITSWYDSDLEDPSKCQTSAVTSKTPEFCNILFQNITADAVPGKTSWKHNRPVYLYGRPEMYIHDITFDNVQIASVLGMFLAYCKDIVFKNKCTVVNTKDNSKPVTTQYQASWRGTFDGTASEEDDNDGPKVQETLFQLSLTEESNVTLQYGKDLDLADYATITGGKALLHNGHTTKDAVMIAADGINIANSGGSYILITLDKPLAVGDVIVTTGGDGGYITTAPSTTATDNITNNMFTCSTNFLGTKQVYINRGATKPKIKGIAVYRNYDPNATGIATIALQKNDSAYRYNLQGQRVSKATKGILVSNGKKFIAN